ncbi:MAG: TonB-dependent receptor [Pseudomonadota bacterium]
MANQRWETVSKTALRSILAASASIAALNATPSVLAQEANDEESDVDSIVVTGSRIARTGIDTVRPAIGVDAEALDTRAFTNIADALNEVPAFGGGIDPNGGQNGFTVGQNFVDLFDLGTQRTLTLVNGRRFVSANAPTVFGSAGGLQVDINTIPVALLERIEVVPLAGAAVYGSDAIAGTVNVILRDDYEGFEVSGQYGITEEGDGQTWQVQTVYGANFDNGRGNATLSVEYSRQDGLVRLDRPSIYRGNPDSLNFGQVDLDGDGQNDDFDGDGDADSTFRIIDEEGRVQLLSFGGSVSVPPAFFAPSAGFGALADGNFYQFDRQGNLQACEPGETPAGSIFFANGGTCGVDFFDSVTQIRSDLERFVVSGFGHYDLTENVRISQEFTFANTRATELLNQGGFQSFPFGGTSGPISVSVNNPFLTDQARGVLTSNGLTDFNVNRFNNDLVANGADNTENFTWRSATIVEGDFEFAGRDWRWDVSGVFGQSDVETQGFGIVDGRFLNAVDAVTLSAESLQPIIDEGLATTVEEALAVFVNDGGSGVTNAQLGDIVCQVNIDNAAGTIPDGFNTPASGGGITDDDLPFVTGCVPLNLFGEGNQSPESINFITGGGPQITSSDIGQRVFTANIGGDIFDLPAGPVAIALGFENRRETASFQPGLGSSVPITRSSPISGANGRLNTIEFYGETVIPIFAEEQGVPFFKSLEISGSIRRVRNAITDQNDNTTADSVLAWEGGGRWSPVEDVTFRGSYTQSIRTPSLVELFTPTVQAFIAGDDPCDNRFLNDGPNPDARQTNCLAAAIAAGNPNAVLGTDAGGTFGIILNPGDDAFVSNISNATILGATQGNPGLVPEQARSWTAGVVIEPRWVDNLVITADVFNINIANRIENFEIEDIFETCFDDLTNFPNEACNSFERDTTFQVVDATEQFLNAASSNFRGVGMQLLYNFDLSDAIGGVGLNRYADRDLGEVRFNWNVLRTLNDVTTLVPTRPGDQDAGDFADPLWQATFDTTWEKGPFRFFYRVEYQDSPLIDETGDTFLLDDNDNVILDTRARLIHNMSFAYTLFDTTTVQFSVDNLLDRSPNRVETAFQYFGIDEELGRRYTFRVRSQF